MMIRLFLLNVLLLSLLGLSSIGRAAEPQTVAESSGFTATSTSPEVREFCGKLAAGNSHVLRTNIGATVEGREIDALVVAQPPVRSPLQLESDERLVVLLLGNIHSGECAGKESLLALARELAADENHPMLRDVVFVIVPNYNADGNDRVGKHHRSRQAGPAKGAGLRENVQGLDLNRDFTKLDSPEARSLVNAINDWNPHLFIDTHTTNGSYHRYDLTYSGSRNPLADPALRKFVHQTFLPDAQRRCQEAGVATFEYGNFNAKHDKWMTYGAEGRYSTEYLGLRGRIGILSEAYAYTPYKRRIESSSVFVRSCLQAAIANKKKIRDLLADVSARNRANDGREISLRSKLAAGETATVAGFAIDSVDQKYYSETKLVRGKHQDHQVTLETRYESSESIKLPRAYVVSRNHPRIADRLLMHGIRVQQVLVDATQQGRSYTVKKITRKPQSFQGRRQRDFQVAEKVGATPIQRGDYLIACDQPLAPLAAYLLEPRSEDGLAHWSFFSQLSAGMTFPVVGLLDQQLPKARTITQVSATKELTLDEIYGPEKRLNFSGAFPTGLRWDKDAQTYVRRWGNRQVRVDAASGAHQPLARPSNSDLEKALQKLDKIGPKEAKKMAASAAKSPQKDAVLMTFSNDLFYRRDGEAAARLTNNKSSERFASFSPDGKWLAFVRDKTLFAIDLDGFKEKQLSDKGSAEKFYGELDWVYQEEIYGRGKFKAFWWSPDSSRIAYLRLDEKPVGRYTVANNIPVRQNLEVTRYPKSGDALPHAALGVVAVAEGNTDWIEPPSKPKDETLIVRVGWDKQNRLIYQTQNRRQTELTLFAVSKGSEPTKLLHEDAGAWVNVLAEPTWLKDGSFLWLSERTGYKHLYVVSSDGKNTRALTSGDWNVERLLGVDPKEEWVYFSGGSDWPRESHAFRVPIGGGEPQKLTSKAGNHSARFSDDFSYFFDYYSMADTPTKVDLRTNDGKYVRTIEANIPDRLAYYRLSTPEFVSVKARDGHMLSAMLTLPPGFDKTKKYPVLCYVYSGPQAPTVRNRWGGSTFLWHQMLAQKGYIIWQCDNRSAGGTAQDAWPIYGDLGKEELKDIEDGLAWLKSNKWVDADRIGIWGWSYGGYMTSYALTHSKQFRMGIAGAPVTDWKNYDAVYTERYMDLPQNNKEGYISSSSVKAAKNLSGRLLLIHGTIDDNVHLGNSLQMAEALQNARRPFQMMFYPQNRHSVGKPNQSRHLRDLMTKFILDNL